MKTLESRFSFRVTGSAENWFSFSWFKWDFAFLSAFGAGCFVHFSWPKISLEPAASAVSIKISHVYSSYMT